MSGLVLRQHFGQHFVDAELPRHGFSGAMGITGEHHNPHTASFECGHRFWRAFLDRISYCGDAGGNSADPRSQFRNHADRFVADRAPRLDRKLSLEDMHIGAADRGGRNPEHGLP